MSRLNSVKSGKDVVLLAIDGGQCCEQRLVDMGFLPGETIHVITNSKIGPLVCLVKGSKFALGHGLAEKLVVKDTWCNDPAV
ncbi:FeoA domain-containing protein [bacterium]|nr:FeoA domain-containing protein [bacterium]